MPLYILTRRYAASPKGRQCPPSLQQQHIFSAKTSQHSFSSNAKSVGISSSTARPTPPLLFSSYICRPSSTRISAFTPPARKAPRASFRGRPSTGIEYPRAWVKMSAAENTNFRRRSTARSLQQCVDDHAPCVQLPSTERVQALALAGLDVPGY